MATSLRKDEPKFEEDEITTADLAQGKRPASEARGPQPVLGERNVEEAVGHSTEHGANAETVNGQRSRSVTIKKHFNSRIHWILLPLLS